MKMFKKFTLLLLLGLSTYAFADKPSNQNLSEEQVTDTPPTTSQVTTPSNRVNINTASVTELQDKLVGIGEKKAQAIVDYRTKNGNFKSIEQFAEVSGIGQAILEKNKNNLTLE